MKTIIFILILSSILKSQIINGINHFPHTAIRISGLGNKGFDDYNGIYNPKFKLVDSVLVLSLSGMLNNSLNRYGNLDNKEIRTLQNKEIVLPEFSLKYKGGSFQIAINYFTNVLSFQKFTDNSSKSLNFRTNSGIYNVIVSNESNFKSIGKKLQFSTSFLIFENSSISFGVQSNSFEQISNWLPLEPMSLKTDLFTNEQFLFSFNHTFKNNSSVYLLVTSQFPGIHMNKNAFFRGEEIISQEYFLSLPGNIGYGYQFSLSDRIKISGEMSHQFIEIDEEHRFENYIEKIVYHIWNNEFILGINAKLMDQLFTGISISKYLKYDNNIYVKFFGDGPDIFEVVGPSKPLSILAGIRYSFIIFDLSFDYQHSFVDYKPNKYGGHIEDYANYFKLTFTTNISDINEIIP